jgi:hypothetical protein
MWRALAIFVGVLLAVGTYAALAGDPPEPVRQPAADKEGPSTTSLGFALAAGAVALAATLMVSRPRRRMR